MYKSVRGMRKMPVLSTDGPIGLADQVFFDDEGWAIRYLVLALNDRVSWRRVLVSPAAVDMVDDEGGQIRLRVGRKQVMESPDIDTDMPVSRQKELEINRYYSYGPYWGGPGLWGAGVIPSALLSAQAATRIAAHEQTGDVHLRSSREVIGYRVQARDGRLGRIRDFIYDEGSWLIRFIEVGTGGFLVHRSVLFSPLWAKKVSWDERTVSLDVSKERFRTAPRYQRLQDVTSAYEAELLEQFPMLSRKE